MSYIGHRPIYAIDNACLRIAYGKVEIWSVFESYDRRIGVFKRRLFCIPLFFFPMLADNLQRLRLAFFNFDDPEEGQNAAIELEFGIGGYINGTESRMKLGNDRKFYFTWGDNVVCIESLSKLDVLTKDLIIVAPAMLTPPVVFENYWNSLISERVVDMKSRFGNEISREILTFVNINYDLFNSLFQLNGQCFDVQNPTANIIDRNFKKHADVNKHKKRRKITVGGFNESLN